MVYDIWNLLIAIKNGQHAKHNYITYYGNSKKLSDILKLLWDNGFITGYLLNFKQLNKLIIFLKYIKGEPSIKLIKFISKPTWRFYCSANQICKINKFDSFIIFSTNNELQPINNCKRLKIGGEPLILIK